MKISWSLVKKNISELKPYEFNPREITEKGLKDLRKSIDKFGLAEPIIVNKDNIIIGGHARYFVLKEKGIKVVECYEPNRLLNENEYKELNIRLNKNIAGKFDFDILANHFDVDELLDWGFEDYEFGINTDDVIEDEKDRYTDKIEAPIYKIKGEKPKINDLLDKSKEKELINEIENSNLSKEEKLFLIESAKRHIVFNYENIAEYYAHASKEMQELMEKSALVIIDFNKAIEYGYIELTNELKERFRIDYR